MGQPTAWQRRFYTIFAGQAFSLIGSQLVQFSLIWWLTETTGSAGTLAVATIMSQIPVITIGPIAGALVDRWPRKWTLILSDGAIALMTAFLGLLFWLDVAQVWHVYVILFLRALADRFQEPAMIASTSAMVPRDQLARVGGMLATVQGVMLLMAPVLGALLLEVLGIQGVLPLDVLTAMVAIAPLLFVTIPEIPVAERVGAGVRGITQGLAQGWHYMTARSGLWQLEITSALWALVFSPAMTLMPLLIRGHFGGGALDLGWFHSAYGAGVIVGGLVLGVWGGFRKSLDTSIAGTLGMAFAVLIIALSPSDMLWLAVVGAVLAGLANPALSSGFQVTLQRVIEPSMQGRYFGLHSSLNRAIGPLALAVAAPIAERHGVRPFWFVAAAGAAAIALLQRFVPDIYHLEDDVLAAAKTPKDDPVPAAVRPAEGT